MSKWKDFEFCAAGWDKKDGICAILARTKIW